MIVIDASAVVDLLLGEPLGSIGAHLARLLEAEVPLALAAPHLLDAEVGQVLRRYVRRGELDVGAAREGLANLAALPVTRYPHLGLVERAFDLRANVTVYDGLYLALAEALQAPLLTADAGLVGVPGCAASVQLVPS